MKPNSNSNFYYLGTFDDSLSGYVEKLFAKRNVNVLTGSAVAKVEGNTVTLTSAKEIPFGVCVWSTGNKALDFVQNLGLPLSKDGRILVNENLKVEGVVCKIDLTKNLSIFSKQF